MSNANEGRNRAVLYLRTSTTEQHVSNQLAALEEIARRRGLAGRFDVLIIWALDRLGRSMVGNVQAVLDLDRWGVQLVSSQEGWLDTAGPVRELLVGVFGWVASEERRRIASRVRAGQERARKSGVHLGRPRVDVDMARARALREQGNSLRTIARRLKVSTSTVHRAFQKTSPEAAAETPEI